MEEAVLERLLAEAQENNQEARARLIQYYKGEIASLAGSICGRSLDWDNDDELSIGLIAFNEAIDSFDSKKGKNFWAYARMVIHRRLVDHFRRESGWKKRNIISLPDDPVWVKREAQLALTSFRREEEAKERAEMVSLFAVSLQEYKISLHDLVRLSPKHRDTKENLMRAALLFRDEPRLLEKLLETKQLPLKELISYTGLSRKVLERGRKYLIALALILTQREFAPLRSLINFPVGKEGETGE
ncbi:MAG: RNA polymerase sigma-I factor [Clostridia bacterium]|nr:RNA polymerase sigma-I factor [Clostridia bacterium]